MKGMSQMRWSSTVERTHRPWFYSNDWSTEQQKHGIHCVSDRWQFDCLSTNLPSVTTRKTFEFRFVGLFMRWPVDSRHKRPSNTVGVSTSWRYHDVPEDPAMASGTRIYILYTPMASKYNELIKYALIMLGHFATLSKKRYISTYSA